MSLLNQMLKDLDQRRVEGAGMPAVHREVRPLPAMQNAWAPRVLGASLFLLGVSGGAAGWWFFFNPARALPPVTSPPPQLASLTLPTLVVAAPAAPDATSSLPDSLAPATDGGGEASVGAPDGSLRLSEQLTLASSLARPRAAETAVSAPAVVREPPRPVADHSIDKRELMPDGHEQAERLYRAAVARLALGQEHEGVSGLRLALEQDPAHVAARQLLIKASIDRKAFDQAQVDIEAGLAKLPKRSDWVLLLARLRIESKDAAGALAVLERYEPTAGGAAAYQGAMAAVLQRLNRHEEAEARFSRAARMEPTNGRWWLGSGMSREALGLNAEARDAYRSALAAGGLDAELRVFAEAKTQ